MAEELPKWTAQKIFILVMVIVFVVSSFGLTALVVWQEVTADDPAVTQTETLDANTQEEDMLQGTQLADFTPVSIVDELQVITIKEGDGKEATGDSTVTVNYTGAVAATGTIFQSSLDTGQPATFPVSGVIAGWQEGIPGMKEGGTYRLIIPAEKAYGANPPQGSGIPADAALVFDVDMITVQ